MFGRKLTSLTPEVNNKVSSHFAETLIKDNNVISSS